MSEDLRIEAARDLTPEGYALVLPLLDELADLETRWTLEEDEEAYAGWRALLPRIHQLMQEHYAGGAPPGDALP